MTFSKANIAHISSLLLLLIVIFTHHLNADTRHKFVFQYLTLEEGLPSLEVSSIYQQSNGFMWFGTSRGASRFDGYEFKNYQYNPSSESHISNNFVIQIDGDSIGNIWIATENGLNKIAPDGKITLYSQNDGMSSNWIVRMFVDRQDNIWLSTGSGVLLLDTKTNEFKEINVESYNMAADILELPTGEIIAAIDQRIYWLNSSQPEAPELFPGALSELINTEELITTMAVIDNKRLLVGTEQSGVFDINLKSGNVSPLKLADALSSDYIYDILDVSKPHFLIAHYASGLSLADKETGHVQKLQHHEFDGLSLVSNSVHAVFVDDANNLWAATDNGIAKAVLEPKFEFFRASAEKEGLSANMVNRVITNDYGSLYVLSNNVVDSVSLENQIVSRNVLKMDDFSNKQAESIWSLTKQNNSIWFASSKGLIKFNSESGVFDRFSNIPGNPYGLPASDIYTVLAEPSGGIWITGYYDIGLTLFDEAKGVVKQFLNKYTDTYQIEGNYTQEKILASDGHIWMATTDGVFRVNRDTGNHQHIRFGEDRGYIRASDIAEDQDQVIWVTTEGAGLVKITQNLTTNEYDLKYYTSANGLHYDDFVSLAIEGDHIWLFSNQKLIKFNKTTEQAHVFDGLFQIPNINFTTAAAFIHRERLVAPSNKGLIVIDYKNLEQSQYPAPVRITEIETNHEHTFHVNNYEDNLLTDGNIRFKFASLDFTTFGQKHYLYRLQNYNDDWTSTELNTASYGNLPPGDYVFEVIGTNSDGVWNITTERYAFTVVRPTRDYVIAVLMLLFLASILLYLNQRRRQVHDLHSQVRIDSLTGLPNRIAFNEQLKRSMGISDSVFALAVMDFDRFKDINDIHGHAVGDEFLKEVGDRLRNSIKGRDYIARLSGDEFVMVIYHFINEDNLMNILNRVIDELNEKFQINNISLTPSVSAGVAIFPRDGTTQELLFAHADSAMYQAKTSGKKNHLYFFNDDLRKKLQRRISIKANLDKALKNNEFELYYQPKVNPKTKA
ncbi:MAG: diguanylate cyclase, partial [Gammaproteobacteria bacterium]|nr:diguanylate cyclase [Gammaproteobacteria bacterium]